MASVPMATLKRVAPIFPVRDLSVSLVHYQRLGFTTRERDGGGCGYATRDGVEVHLRVVLDSRRSTTTPLGVPVGSMMPMRSQPRGVRRVPRSICPRTQTGASTRAEPVKPGETTSHADLMSASGVGSLIQAMVGSFGGWGRRCRNRAGLAA